MIVHISVETEAYFEIRKFDVPGSDESAHTKNSLFGH